MKIDIKYHAPITRIEKLMQGDWIDLRAAETVTLKKGDSHAVSLGVAMQLPAGYEAHMVARSSTFRRYGVIQVNGTGIIDESFCGDNDIWNFLVYATRDTVIPFDDRICQFRIVEKMPTVSLHEVEFLQGKDRGGLGSTGAE